MAQFLDSMKKRQNKEDALRLTKKRMDSIDRVVEPVTPVKVKRIEVNIEDKDDKKDDEKLIPNKNTSNERSSMIENENVGKC